MSRSEIESYCEFHEPSAPSVGAHAGKQSKVSWNVRLRTMMLVRLFATLAVPRMSSHAPRMRRVAAEADDRGVRAEADAHARLLRLSARRRAQLSSGPVGVTRPHTAGSYVARNASSVKPLR